LPTPPRDLCYGHSKHMHSWGGNQRDQTSKLLTTRREGPLRDKCYPFYVFDLFLAQKIQRTEINARV
jgi:hypothetical protein